MLSAANGTANRRCGFGRSELSCRLQPRRNGSLLATATPRCSPSSPPVERWGVTCRERAAQDRRAADKHGEIGPLFACLGPWPLLGERDLEISARHGHPTRTASVERRAGPLTLLPHVNQQGKLPCRFGWSRPVSRESPPRVPSH